MAPASNSAAKKPKTAKSSQPKQAEIDLPVVFAEYIAKSATETLLTFKRERPGYRTKDEEVKNPNMRRLCSFFRTSRVIHLNFVNYIPKLNNSEVKNLRKALKTTTTQRIVFKTSDTENLLPWTKVFPKHILHEWASSPDVFDQGINLMGQFASIECGEETTRNETMLNILKHKKMEYVKLAVFHHFDLEPYVEEWKAGERDIRLWTFKLPQSELEKVPKTDRQEERIDNGGKIERLHITINKFDEYNIVIRLN